MTGYTQEQRFDHARDQLKHESSPRHKRAAVQQLVGYCWGLTHGDLLGPEIAKQLRTRIKVVCIEFGMDPPVDPVPRNPDVPEPLRTIVNSFGGGFGQ